MANEDEDIISRGLKKLVPEIDASDEKLKRMIEF